MSRPSPEAVEPRPLELAEVEALAARIGKMEPREPGEEGWFRCPTCDGEGELDGKVYDASEVTPLTIGAYGIGDGLRDAEAWVELTQPARVLATVREASSLKAQLEAETMHANNALAEVTRLHARLVTAQQKLDEARLAEKTWRGRAEANSAEEKAAKVARDAAFGQVASLKAQLTAAQQKLDEQAAELAVAKRKVTQLVDQMRSEELCSVRWTETGALVVEWEDEYGSPADTREDLDAANERADSAEARVAELKALLLGVKIVLDKHAQWHDGSPVGPHFDDPWCAESARHAIEAIAPALAAPDSGALSRLEARVLREAAGHFKALTEWSGDEKAVEAHLHALADAKDGANHG